MLILGLESSCDETAASVVKGGTEVLSNVVASQAEVHGRFGGVVPELASRAHIVKIMPVVRAALDDAQVVLTDLDGIAVTNGPGLVGGLLVALQAAKGLSFATGIPMVGVHHLEGHMTAIDLEGVSLPYPHVALVVSGGHTCLLEVGSRGSYRLLGTTRDDAAGEAFDKVAKLLGLGYPGGRAIDERAKLGNPERFDLPKAMLPADTRMDFSYSGLKTAVLNLVQKKGTLTEQDVSDICAVFQSRAVELLIRKTKKAMRSGKYSHLQVCGGVAANSHLREEMGRLADSEGFNAFFATPKYCTDNAAMIAAAGYHRIRSGHRDEMTLQAFANLALPQ